MDQVEGEDPQPVTWHRYIYAGSEPVNETDPSGQEFELAGISAANIGFAIQATLAVARNAVLAATIVCSAEAVTSTIANDPTNSPCQMYWGSCPDRCGKGGRSFRVSSSVSTIA
jgi:hypothetical protein